MPTKHHILIISSDRSCVGEVQASLDADSHAISSVESARQAQDELRQHKCDVVLIDLGEDPEQMIAAAEAVQSSSPATPILAILRPGTLPGDISESELFIRAVRSGVRDFLRRPIARDEFQQVIGRLQGGSRQREHLAKVIGFISTKGGVGKSTLAVNTACGLAARNPGKVLLIDASLQLGVCAAMLDVQPESTFAELAAERHRLDPTLLRQFVIRHECGLDLLAAPADAVAASDVDASLMAQVLTCARKTYDFVVVDTFPMFDRVVVEIIDACDRVYVVVENVVPTLLGCAKLVEVLDKLEMSGDEVRVLLNRYLKLPGGLSPADASMRLSRNIDHVFPYDRRIMVAANTGNPFALSAPRWNRFARELSGLVQEVSSLNSSTHQSSNGAHRGSTEA